MRKYTLLFSILAHAGAAGAVLFTTVLATTDLPVPRDGSVFVNVVPSPPPAVPPAPRPHVEPSVESHAAPISAPEGIRPEPERPLLSEIAEPVPEGLVGGFGTGTSAAIPDEPPPPPRPLPSRPVRVGGGVTPPTRIVYVPPTYPSIALAAKISGYVILEATIGEDGTVRDVRVLKSIPLLDDAAKEAVRQWRFTPTLLNGQPVSVLMTVTVTFTLH